MKVKVNIPSNTTDLTLGQFQHIMRDIRTNDQRGAYILKEFSKKNPDDFEPEKREAIFLTMMKLMEFDKVENLPTKIDGYKLPAHLLKIRVGHFIEIVNAQPDSENLDNAEIVAGCLFRKDWDADFSEEEILDTAYKFREKPLLYTLTAMLKMAELFQMLQETYPLLYDKQINKEAEIEETEDEGRRLYDMLQGLAGGQFINWRKAKNEILADAFVYLEEVKKEQIKQRLNEKNRR